MARRVAVAVAVLAALLLLCSTALADADPASDVLLVANAFYPYSPPVSSRLQATLDAELSDAHRHHFPIKVAEIATSMDLGAIPQLYERPRQYAAFLDQEISFAGKVPVLVVMPNGYGSAGLGPQASVTVASLRKPAARTGNALTQAAIAAVRELADAAGHPLGRVSVPARAQAGGSGVVVPLVILLAVCGALAGGILTIRRRRAHPTVLRRR